MNETLFNKNKEALPLKVYKKFFKVLKPYWWLIALAIPFTIGNSVSNLLTPIMGRETIQFVQEYTGIDIEELEQHYQQMLEQEQERTGTDIEQLRQEYSFEDFIPEEVQHQYWWYIGLFALIALGIYGTMYLQNLLMAIVGKRIIIDLRVQTFAKMLNLPLRFFHNQRVGDILSRFNADITNIEDFISYHMIKVINYGLIILLGIAYLFYRNYMLTLAGLLLAPLMIWVIQILGKLTRRFANEIFTRMGEINSILQQNLYGIEAIKAFHSEEIAKKQFDKESDFYYKVSKKALYIIHLVRPLTDFVSFLAAVVILAVGIYQILTFDFTLPGLIEYILILLVLSLPINGLSQFWNALQRTRISMERIFNLMDEIPEEYNLEKGKTNKIQGEVTLEHVSFNYNPGEIVLDDIHLHIKKGEVVALVGASGGGKTTLVNLIPRFYDVSEGKVLVDGMDVKEYNLLHLRSSIGMVGQENILFSGSIKDNIQFGNPNASQEEIEQAARDANAQEFILSFPDGYETQIGERGVKLSGGQKQRIALARAMIKKPAIMILDEATSALDTESEIMVQQALAKIVRNQTTIVIAHRLSTVKNADRILVIENGKITESGTHEELMKMEGHYAKLYSLQFR